MLFQENTQTTQNYYQMSLNSFFKQQIIYLFFSMLNVYKTINNKTISSFEVFYFVSYIYFAYVLFFLLSHHTVHCCDCSSLDFPVNFISMLNKQFLMLLQSLFKEIICKRDDQRLKQRLEQSWWGIHELILCSIGLYYQNL